MGSLPPGNVVEMANGKDTYPAEQEASSERPPWRGTALIAALTLVGIVVVILYGYLAKPGWVGVSDKKFWDYLELLIVPAALAVGVYWLNRAQRERELEVENERARDVALEAYLDQMSQLLFDKDRPLRKSEQGDEVRTLARARTLTVMRKLDGARKGSVVRFLYESGLIGGDPSWRRGATTVVYLDGTDLSGAHLSGVRLDFANLRGANLHGADLHSAHPVGAYLYEADLSEADLSGANPVEADLSRANLREANLGGVGGGADLRYSSLNAADLTGLRACLVKVRVTPFVAFWRTRRTYLMALLW